MSLCFLLGMMPFWLFVLGRGIVNSVLVIPYTKMLTTLVT